MEQGEAENQTEWNGTDGSKPLAAFCLQYILRKKGVTLGNISNSSKMF